MEAIEDLSTLTTRLRVSTDRRDEDVVEVTRDTLAAEVEVLGLEKFTETSMVALIGNTEWMVEETKKPATGKIDVKNVPLQSLENQPELPSGELPSDPNRNKITFYFR
ncbi:hypothetical protein L6452_42392 [Arctium lappa]|uniref:Uncharacterized protein n=1 Tax=Arctium lappa TaxID=4217 RepID=A0ACB8XIW3_ARCLA|nr:hypothetical protein L6452_42392 [Arctium lappa]